MEEYSSIISNSNIINLISKIHEYKGKQSYLLDTKKDTLETLLKVARIQSTSSSNKIEGIYTTDKRINEIVNQKVEPKNRNEEEIAGYRDVLTLIHENYNFIDINQNTILQLHRDLYKYTGYSYGGKFKNSQNFIEEENENGKKKIRFTPLSPIETPIAIEDLCKNYNNLVNNELCDLLVLIPIFILDFLSIHPFNDGNGRMSRLLTLLLLYKANYMVGKYISIEKIIEETKDSYYDTLEKSSINWYNNENDYSYFVEYYLGIILNAYKEFDSRISIIENKKITAYDRIIDIFKNNIIPIDKAFVTNKCPDLSETTIERILNKLLKEDNIVKISGGRYTKYKWNN
ncbi:MAG: Fic family protein [Acholeplasma sp.]|mgnify:FL=1|jgi:Fic family protein|nr:Fic family protein [Acholeplasma sp.]